MLIFNGTEYRNLEEQVLENKQKIAEHYNIDRVLADFGIRVVGQVSNYSNLPDPATYEGEYGDAYAVGTKAPYSFYVWTRADANAGHPNDYWFNIGNLAIVGPEGPEGKQGETGPQGKPAKWLTSNQNPNSANLSGEDGTLCLITANTSSASIGDVFQYSLSANEWTRQINIRGAVGATGPAGATGPQGPAGPIGPTGPQGPAGGFVKIYGILSSVDELPLPSTLNDLTVAYLVGSASPYSLYIQVGSTAATATWTNQGPLNAGTAVRSGGVFVEIFNADDKLTIPSGMTYPDGVLAHFTSVNQGSRRKTSTILNNPDTVALLPEGNYKVPAYNQNGTINANAPIEGKNVMTKEHYDNNIAADVAYHGQTVFCPLLPGITGITKVYTQTGTTTNLVAANNTATAGAFIRRDANGNFQVNEPTADNMPASKKYVDDAIAAKHSEDFPLYDIQWNITGSVGDTLITECFFHTYGRTEDPDIWSLAERIYPATGEVRTNEDTYVPINGIYIHSTYLGIRLSNGTVFTVENTDGATITATPFSLV